ncbi:PaaX family transcriptional regulator [Yinghuangia soli]|uniref:PaaX family transcriptional regulator n=1 Tax=Yinghuangia soli TaxID=2908204 RepID=A0AA41U2N5_9ACTN|nr:PaaX family transcriptional regulator C-terminal domain-containing protein [Yinghuangia soli]MCF2530881.1 PaaX family transcriptional regulator [Yinghuangia soli]
MADTAIRPSSLINTIYGAFIRRLGGWVSIADLIKLMAESDVDAPAVRSAISRLKKRGTLVQERQAGMGYRLSPSMGPIFDEGDRRIFGHLEPARLEDGWVVAVFSVPESERAHRHQLRARLTWLGFGNVSPGVWIAPGRLLDDARATLGRVGLSSYVHLFSADYEAYSDLGRAVSEWWDFAAIEKQYAAFTATYEPRLRDFRAAKRLAPEDAFRAYVPMLTEWRRLPYLDPGLPAELLPQDWNAVEARRVFLDQHGILAEPSRRHVARITGLSDADH